MSGEARKETEARFKDAAFGRPAARGRGKASLTRLSLWCLCCAAGDRSGWLAGWLGSPRRVYYTQKRRCGGGVGGADGQQLETGSKKTVNGKGERAGAGSGGVLGLGRERESDKIEVRSPTLRSTSHQAEPGWWKLGRGQGSMGQSKAGKRVGQERLNPVRGVPSRALPAWAPSTNRRLGT